MSETLRETQAHRQSSFKKGIDTEDSRRRRDDMQLSIRKQKREDKLQKRRFKNTNLTKLLNEEELDVNVMTEMLLKTDNVNIQENAKKLYSNDYPSIIEAALYFRMLVTRPEPPIGEIINANVVPRLIQLSTASKHPELQHECLWILTNIVSGTSEETRSVVDNGGVPVFIRLMNSDNPKIRDEAVWALGNIAGDSVYYRDMILAFSNEIDVVSLIAKNIAYAPDEEIAQNAIWLASNLVRVRPYPSYEEVAQRIIPALVRVMNYPKKDLTSDLVSDIFWILNYLTDTAEDGEKKINALIKSGLVLKVLEHIQNQPKKSLHLVDPQIQLPGAKIIGNIVSGSDNQTQYLLDNDVLSKIPLLLGSPRKTIRKEAFWTLSNIAAGNRKQIETLIRFKNQLLLSKTIHALGNDSSWEVKKEAAHVLSNILTSDGMKGNQYILLLIDMNAIKPVTELLKSPSVKIIKLGLSILRNILQANDSTPDHFDIPGMIEEVGGLDLIEALQTHENEKVYDMAVDIIETFYNNDAYDRDEYIAPPILPPIPREEQDRFRTFHVPLNAFKYEL